MIWKEGTSGKQEEKNYSNIFFPFFFFNMRKSQADQPRAKIEEGSTRAWQKYPGQNQYLLKNGDQDHYRSKIAHKSDWESAKALSSRQLPSGHLDIRNSPSKSQSSSVLREFSSWQLPSDHLNIWNSPLKSQSSSVLRELISRQLPSDHLNIRNSPSKRQSSPVPTLLTIIRN